MNADGVLIVFGVHPMTRLIDGAYRESCDPVYDAWLQDAFTDMLKTMEAFGPVWLVLAAVRPRPTNGEACRSHERDADTDCTNRDFRAAVAAAAPNAASSTSTASSARPDRDCVEEVGGVPLRPDGLHYEGPGADIVARWLLAQIGVHPDASG